MDPKIISALDKIQALKNKGDYAKALAKLQDLVKRSKGEIRVYTEAIETSLEAGESIQACQFFKKAHTFLPSAREQLWDFAKEITLTCSDPILAKTLLDQAVKNRDLNAGLDLLDGLENGIVSDLLKRNRVKKQALLTSSAGEEHISGDLLVNMLAEYLLCLKTGKKEDSAAIIVKIAENTPDEKEVIESFLARRSSCRPDDGTAAYALGCCYSLTGKHGKALEKFTQSIRTDPVFIDEIAARIQDMQKTGEHPGSRLDVFLSEIYLVKEDLPAAAETMANVLERDPEQAPGIMDLLDKYFSALENEIIPEYIFIEAAVLSKQISKAVDHITKCYSNDKLKEPLLTWMDKKFNECFFPPKVLLKYGEIALQESMCERALEALQCVAELSPADLPVIRSLLADCNKQDAKIKAYLEEISPKEQEQETSGDFGIEHFEKSEFHFTPKQEPGDQPANFEPLLKNEGVFTSSSLKEELDYDAKPAPHFETESGTSKNPGYSTAKEEPAETKEKPEEKSADPLPDNSFNQSLREFEEGKLNNEQILDLTEKALINGRNSEVEALLKHTFDSNKDDSKRKLFLARYHMKGDSPLEALIVLKSISLDGLPRGQRRDILSRIAACYRILHLYEAAQAALLALTCDYPSDAALESLIKLNYTDYLKEQSGAEVVLEKSSSID